MTACLNLYNYKYRNGTNFITQMQPQIYGCEIRLTKVQSQIIFWQEREYGLTKILRILKLKYYF